MNRLRHADLEGTLRFLGEAASVEGDRAFPEEVVGALRKLVPCDWAGYCEHDVVGRLDLWFSQDPGYYSAEFDEEFWALYDSIRSADTRTPPATSRRTRSPTA